MPVGLNQPVQTIYCSNQTLKESWIQKKMNSLDSFFTYITLYLHVGYTIIIVIIGSHTRQRSVA